MRSPLEEVVFDELHVRIVTEHLMVDVTAARVRTDDDTGHADAVTVFVDLRRRNVIVESAPVVPREKDRRAVPVRTACMIALIKPVT